jgi:TPR repeat protein
MYESGLGVEHDTEEAIRWYRLAARQMQQQAIDALKRLGVDIHGPVVKPVAPKVSAAVEDRVRKALENVLSKDSAKLTQNK